MKVSFESPWAVSYMTSIESNIVADTVFEIFDGELFIASLSHCGGNFRCLSLPPQWGGGIATPFAPTPSRWGRGVPI